MNVKLVATACLLVVSGARLMGQAIKYPINACTADSSFAQFGLPHEVEFKGKYDNMMDTTVVELHSETTSSLIANTERTLLLGMRFGGKALSLAPEFFFQSRWKVTGGDNGLMTKDLTAQSKLDENQALAILVDDSIRMSLSAGQQNRKQSTNILAGHTMTENTYFLLPADQLMRLLRGNALQLRTGGHLFKWSGESLRQAKDVFRTAMCGQMMGAKGGS